MVAKKKNRIKNLNFQRARIDSVNLAFVGAITIERTTVRVAQVQDESRFMVSSCERHRHCDTFNTFKTIDIWRRNHRHTCSTASVAWRRDVSTFDESELHSPLPLSRQLRGITRLDIYRQTPIKTSELPKRPFYRC